MNNNLEQELMTSRLPRSIAEAQLRHALELVLLYHSGGEWTPEKDNTWVTSTGRAEATTKALCDFVRQTLENTK